MCEMAMKWMLFFEYCLMLYIRTRRQFKGNPVLSFICQDLHMVYAQSTVLASIIDILLITNT